MAVIPLCVPFERKDEARRAGARWDQTQRVWACDTALLTTNAYAQLRPFVPRMHRPDLKPPYLRPWMVPAPLWGRNLRSMLPQEHWDIVRRHAYEAAGKRCRICGGRGPEWPVEADEAWEYDDEKLTHTLKGVIALCPDCHHVRHWGKTAADGGEEEAFAKLMAVNRWSRATAEEAVAFAYEQWERRSDRTWTSDFSWVTRTHGIALDPNGARRADAANRSLLDKAARQADEAAKRHYGEFYIPELDSVRPTRTHGSSRPPRKRTLFGYVKALFR